MRNVEKHPQRRLVVGALTTISAVLLGSSIVAVISIALRPAPASAKVGEERLERSAPRNAALVAGSESHRPSEGPAPERPTGSPAMPAVTDASFVPGATAAAELVLLRERAPGEHWELEQRTRAVAQLAQVLAATPSALTEGERSELERRHARLEEKLRDQEESVERMEERIAALTKVGAERVDAPRTAEGAER